MHDVEQNPMADNDKEQPKERPMTGNTRLQKLYMKTIEPILSTLLFDIGFIPITRILFSNVSCVRGDDSVYYLRHEGCETNSTRCQALPRDHMSVCWSASHSGVAGAGLLLSFLITYCALNFAIVVSRDKFLGVQGRYSLSLMLIKLLLCFFNEIFQTTPHVTLPILFVCISWLLVQNIHSQPCKLKNS